eukprot:6175897-Pleurochrysis_carterae.AAC.4
MAHLILQENRRSPQLGQQRASWEAGHPPGEIAPRDRYFPVQHEQHAPPHLLRSHQAQIGVVLPPRGQVVLQHRVALLRLYCSPWRAGRSSSALSGPARGSPAISQTLPASRDPQCRARHAPLCCCSADVTNDARAACARRGCRCCCETLNHESCC